MSWWRNILSGRKPTAPVSRKWRIVSKSTGIDYGTYEATSLEGALEAYAQDVAAEQGTSIERCRMLIAEGSYSVTPVDGA